MTNKGTCSHCEQPLRQHKKPGIEFARHAALSVLPDKVIDLGAAVLQLEWQPRIEINQALSDIRGLLVAAELSANGEVIEDEPMVGAYVIFDNAREPSSCELWPMCDVELSLRYERLSSLWKLVGGRRLRLLQLHASLPAFISMRKSSIFRNFGYHVKPGQPPDSDCEPLLI